MKKLFLESIITPFLHRPLCFIKYFLLCLIGIRKWKAFFSYYEDTTALNRVCFFKTLYFNLRSLPLHQAMKMPIYIYEDVEIISSAGDVMIQCDNISTGMIKWGWFYGYRSNGVTRINNRGTIIFHGNGKIIRGCEIMTREGAVLEVGHDFFFGEGFMIYCWDNIVIGNHPRFAYNSQIFDTDFHYSMNTNTGEVRRRCKPVRIGDYNWIGNNTTIKKGTVTPNHIVVAAAYCVLAKDYSKDIPEYSVIGGTPVRLLKKDYSRIWNNEHKRIAEISKWFNEHPASKIFNYDVSNVPFTTYTEII